MRRIILCLPPSSFAEISGDVIPRFRLTIPATLHYIFFLAALLLSVCGASSLVNVRAQSLRAPLERELAGVDQHSYRLTLTGGQFLRARVNQRGIDVILALTGPDGKKLVEVDTPVGEWGTEALFFEIKQSGSYAVTVRPFKTSAPQGRYEFGFEMRQPTHQDEASLDGERAFARATQLLMQKTPESQTQGLEKYKEALGLFESVREHRGELRTLTAMAEVYSFLGEGADALNYFNEALRLAQSMRDRTVEARTLSNIGLVYYSFGDRDKALDYFNRALLLFQALADTRTAAYTINYTGLVYDAMGENLKALERFNQALPVFRAAKDRRGEAHALNNIALAYDAMGDKKKAREYYEQALRVSLTQSPASATLHGACNCNEVAPILSNIAFDLMDSGDKQKALDYLNQALVMQRQINDRQGEATTLNNIGFVYNSMGQADKALDYLTQALVIHHEVNNLRGEGDTFSNLMFTWRSQGNSYTAILYGKQAVNTYQGVRAKFPPLDKRAQKSFLKSRESVYRQLADLLITQGRILEGQQVIGMLKEEEYYQYVRRDGKTGSTLDSRASLAPAEAELGKRYEALAGQITALGKLKAELIAKTQLTESETTLLTKLNADILAANQEFTKFLSQLSTQLASSYQGREKAREIKEAVGFQTDLRKLGSGAVILYTLVGEEKYQVILITPNVRLYREYPIKAADLYVKVAEFNSALKDNSGSVENVRSLAKELYNILVEPVAKDLEGEQAKTLIWSLDGVLRYIPIAALYDGKQYMVERYRNVVFTMLSQSRWQETPSAKWTGIGFGVSKAQGEFRPLPSVPDELRGIFREEESNHPVGGVLQGKILLDADFTKTAFTMGLQQKKYPLVHVASHFQFALGNEASSFLLLGTGDRLSLEEINNETALFEGVELLTLSACETATSEAGAVGADGKEVEGFGELAQRQGASSVIASLWSVNDESTKILMQKFYKFREAQPGMLKAEALRQAQLALLQGDGSASPARFAHPHYWAPFILIGNWK